MVSMAAAWQALMELAKRKAVVKLSQDDLITKATKRKHQNC
jgi:hypothetical protein